MPEAGPNIECWVTNWVAHAEWLVRDLWRHVATLQRDIPNLVNKRIIASFSRLDEVHLVAVPSRRARPSFSYRSPIPSFFASSGLMKADTAARTTVLWDASNMAAQNSANSPSRGSPGRKRAPALGEFGGSAVRNGDTRDTPTRAMGNQWGSRWLSAGTSRPTPTIHPLPSQRQRKMSAARGARVREI